MPYPGHVRYKCGISRARHECTDAELTATAWVNVVSNLCMLPAIYVAVRQGLRFEAAVGCFAILASSLYHLCEPTGFRIYGMNDGQWHRLDNIGACMCFVNLFIYLCDIRERWIEEYLRYGMLCWVMLLQERGPWELHNTVLPIVLAGSLPVVRYALGPYMPLVSSWNHKPDFNSSNFSIGLGLLGIALFFFFLGLEDDNDYLRSKHACWHFFVSAASFWLWRSVRRHLQHAQMQPSKNKDPGV